MTRARPHWHRACWTSGAITTLLALGLLAPTDARASCSHLVTWRNDPTRLSSLIEPLLHDLAGPADPTPARRPCSGAWCSGQPAIPPVPSGAFEGRIGSWAWHAPAAEDVAVDPSFLAPESPAPRPLRRGNDVFHPPRSLPPV
jgi:hypothetical protein